MTERRGTRGDRKTEPMGSHRVRIPFDRSFTTEEWEQMKQGVLPDEMEDKWFIFEEDGVLHFHRSWTGREIFEVHLVRADEGMRTRETWVQADPAQYRPDTPEREAARLDHLIDVVLLHRRRALPGAPVGSMHHLGPAGTEGKAAEEAARPGALPPEDDDSDD